MSELELAKLLIPQLLSSSSPEFGARLKQRLNAELANRGLSTFNEKQFGFRKFSEFLEESLGDIVSLQAPTGPGDIRVTVRPEAVQSVHASVPYSAQTTSEKSSHVIQSDVWQAFANPDERRKRFLKRATKEIIHFLENEESEYKAQVHGSRQDFIEIDPVTADTQREWMRTFLTQLKLSSSDREAFETLIQGKYTSSLNAAFTRALGTHGTAWREFRTRRVTSKIQTWAADNNIAFSDLCNAPDSAKTPKKSVEQSETGKNPMERAIHLLALLSEEDISRIILPTILSTLLVRTNS